MIYLKEIELCDEERFKAFEERYKEECKDEPIPLGLNKENLPFPLFFKKLQDFNSSKTCPKGFVATKFYLIMSDEDIVGEICLRFEDNDFILNYAGHVGYGIAPWERNKGYATKALKKLLVIAKDMNLSQLLITTDENNIASQKVILTCGGVYEKTSSNKRFYWIKLGSWEIEESAMAIVFYNDKILVTYENIYGNCVLSCPKGHIENAETHIETAIRECFEETNIILSQEDFKMEGNPYIVKFLDHHNQLVKKTIYPILFVVKDSGVPLVKEERIISVQFMEIQKFLNECSYDNVKQMVLSCLNYLDLKN